MAMARAHASWIQNGIGWSEPNWPAATMARKITPMVFWASEVPWASATREAVPTWPQRK